MPRTDASRKKHLRQVHEQKLLALLRAVQSSSESDLCTDEETERMRALHKRKKRLSRANRDDQRTNNAMIAAAAAKKRSAQALQNEDSHAESEVSITRAGNETPVPIESDLGDPDNVAIIFDSPVQCGNSSPAAEDMPSAQELVAEQNRSFTSTSIQAVRHAQDEVHVAEGNCSADGEPHVAGIVFDSDGADFQPLQELPPATNCIDSGNDILCATDDEGLQIQSDHVGDEADLVTAQDEVGNESDCDTRTVEQQPHTAADVESGAHQNSTVFYGPENLSIAKQMLLFGEELVSAFCQHDISIAAADHINEVYRTNWDMLTRFCKETGRQIPHFKSHRATCIRKKVPPIKVSTAHRRVDDPSPGVVVETTTDLQTYPNTFSDRDKYKRLWLQCKIQVMRLLKLISSPLLPFNGLRTSYQCIFSAASSSSIYSLASNGLEMLVASITIA